MFENGQGDIVDENGNEIMIRKRMSTPYDTENLSNFIQYCSNQPPDFDISGI